MFAENGKYREMLLEESFDGVFVVDTFMEQASLSTVRMLLSRELLCD